MIKEKILKNANKITNLSLLSLAVYSSLYYSVPDKIKDIISLNPINEFLDNMKNKTFNNPEEVVAAVLTVAGSYTMGHKNPNVRLSTFAMWSISNFLYAGIAIQNNMTPMLGQIAVFQLINLYAMKNILKDEILPMSQKSLEEENFKKSSFMEELKNMKNRAVVNGFKRLENLSNTIKDNINNVINTIKEKKENSFTILGLTVAAMLSTQDFANFNINETSQLIQNLVQKINLNPLETLTASAAVYGSYLLSKTGIDNKIKGVSIFLTADIFYAFIAHQHNLAPMAIQYAILVGGSLKALDNLYKAKSEQEINPKDEKNILKNISEYIKNFTNKIEDISGSSKHSIEELKENTLLIKGR